MLDRVEECFGLGPRRLAADTAYGTGKFLGWLVKKKKIAFGPQHGLRGDKQDNMIESPDFIDPMHGIPVFSLYGQVRKPTDAMMDTCDVMLVDLQDLGCRIYTFITTLRYVLPRSSRQSPQ